MSIFGSLFAGIGGFDLGLQRAEWQCAFQVELDPHAQAVSRYHWPNVERHADVRDVGAATLPPVDLLCGGFPCQDLSVAGRRAGLGGERSGLFWQFLRVASELRPRWLLLENVGGLLSSNGTEDLGAILFALGECGYWWTYRCLDSQHFGVPQRRYRVFVVGHLGGPCPPEILLEPDCLPGDLEARREAREDVAATPARGTESAGRGGYAGRRREDDVNLVARPLLGEAGQRNSPRTSNLVARPLAAHASSYRVDVDTAENLIAGTLGADHGNVRADQAWTGRLLACDLQNGGVGDLCGTLQSEGQATGNRGYGVLARPLRARHNASHRADSDTYVAHTLRAEGHDAGEDGTGRGTPLVALGFQSNFSNQGASGDRPTLTANCPLAVGFATNQRREGRLQEVAGSVHEPSGTQIEGAMTPLGVRRLTPRECERLQGFPDDWTKYGRREDGAAYELKDAPRYRLLGNAVTVPVAEWIAKRIIATIT